MTERPIVWRDAHAQLATPDGGAGSWSLVAADDPDGREIRAVIGWLMQEEAGPGDRPDRRIVAAVLDPRTGRVTAVDEVMADEPERGWHLQATPAAPTTTAP